MAIECASTVEICAIRATRLASDGSVSPTEDNVYIPKDIIQLQFTANNREGDHREMIGGCGGCVIAQKDDDDSFTRMDLELQAGRFEPGLMEMLLGATLVDSTNGPLGFMYGAKRQCGTPQPRVQFEAWSKRWTEDDEQDPVWPWWHHVFSSVSWVLGQNTLQADFGPVVMTGKTRANTSWGFGPYGDQPADMAGNHWFPFADPADTVPAGTCDYSTIT